MFRPLTEAILVSPQISVADVEQAKAMGVTFILTRTELGAAVERRIGCARIDG